MSLSLNQTHDPQAQSWIDSANAGSDFPIQNLPFGAFRLQGTHTSFRCGVAIGNFALDLTALQQLGLGDELTRPARDALRACQAPALNALMQLGPTHWHAFRVALFELLHVDQTPAVQARVKTCLVPLDNLEHTVAVDVHEYTDFYTSLHHAINVGKAVGNEGMVSPNFYWMPIAYHGRASSLGVNTSFRRPLGQVMQPGSQVPSYGPCARLDYELEMAIYIGQSNAQGEPISVGQAEHHIFGMGLLNDWSARDFQFWEMSPLGPFLGKNFATTLSPWVVTLEALAPFRLPAQRPPNCPQPLPYLAHPQVRKQGALDIHLSVDLQTQLRRNAGLPPRRISQTNFKHQHWCISQMVAHHTSGGCNLRVGDVLGTGTVSGPTAEEAGALIELTQAGQKPIDLDSGETRTFLQDGDAITLGAWCEREGAARIGFGTCHGQVLPARAA